MHQRMTGAEPSYRTILHLAWPAILANAAVPLLGLVDTAIIGRVGSTTDLAAVALSSLVLNSIYWTLGFLRMSTTGLVAQAYGAGSSFEISRIVLRALLLGCALGVLLIVFRSPTAELVLRAFGPAPAVAASARTYIQVRLLGAPAVLITFAVTGMLIGLGRTRWLLALQVVMNGVNLLANLGFVVGLQGQFRGLLGIAAGTVSAEWVTALLSLWLLRTPKAAQDSISGTSLASLALPTNLTWIWDLRAWKGVLGVNFNILLRTLALIAGFCWFTRLGAQLGADVLAGNYLVQQVISFAAFFLDGIAFVAEVHVGRAIGAGDAALFRRSVLRTSVVGFGFACALSVLVLWVGPFGICELTPSSAVRVVAIQHLPIAALYVLVGVVPWQLDGIFIGAASGAALRNAAIVSLVVFWGAATWLAPRYGNTGLWWAMLVYIAARGMALAAHWPHLTRRLTAKPASP